MTTTMNTSTTPTVAVIGGTGHTGRRVADRLRAHDVAVRIGSRAGTPPFHWELPRTWAPVLSGCTAAYVAYTPDFTHPGAVETLGAFAEQARASGVTRLVLLSGRGEEDAVRAETAVRAAGVPTAVLRCSVFAQNFSEHFLHESVHDGVVAMPAGDVAEPFVDIDDLADAAAELSAVLGRPVRYQPVTVPEFTAGAVDAGMDPVEAAVLADVFGQIFDGRNAYVTDTVERVLGRPAGDFTAYARRAAASGAWDTTRTEVPA